MASPAPRRMTLDEFLQWDDGTDTRYELIEGEIVAMAPAMPDHSCSYVGDEASGRCAVIDPTRDVEPFVRLARERGLRSSCRGAAA